MPTREELQNRRVNNRDIELPNEGAELRGKSPIIYDKSISQLPVADDGGTPSTFRTYTDPYSVPPFGEEIEREILFRTQVTGLRAPTNLDLIVFRLYDARQQGSDARELRLNIKETPYVTYENGQLKIDALGIVGAEYDLKVGNYRLEVHGYRDYIYADPNVEDGTYVVDDLQSKPFGDFDVNALPFNEVEFGNLTIEEISTSRKEIRVSAQGRFGGAFEDFYRSTSPKILLSKYWLDKANGTVYYGSGDKNADLAFSSPEEYAQHRADLGYPSQRPDGSIDWSGIQEWDNGIWGPPQHLEQDRGIWPCTIKPLSPLGGVISLVSTNWLYDEFATTNSQDKSIKKDTVIFRLTTPLPTGINVGAKIELLRSLFIPFEIPVTLNLNTIIDPTGPFLRGPNLKLRVEEQKGTETDLKSFNDLIGTDTDIQNRLLDKYISGSDSIDINLDYRKFENFIHFSSAAQRLNNFKYKLTEIETYQSKSAEVSQSLFGLSDAGVTGSATYEAHYLENQLAISDIISNFDDYEKYLYYTSHSAETVFGNDGEEIINSATWPKRNSIQSKGSFTLYSVTSSQAEVWYNTQYASASLWDENNSSMLRNVVPLHVKTDDDNAEWLTLYDMTGQHFDQLYNQIRHFENINRRDEDLYTGVSKDILYDVAKSFGWTLQSGFSTSDLWKTVLGTDETGSYQTGEDSNQVFVKQDSYSHEDIEKQTWKRIINNLPYLMKTKGTVRGVQSLLATYGIPTTILNVEEFGGPNKTRLDTKRSIEKFNYALKASGSAQFNVSHYKIDTSDTPFLSTGGTDRWPNMYEFRYNTQTTQSQHLLSSYAGSFNTNGWFPKFALILEHSHSAAGTDSPDAIAAGSASVYAKYGRLQLQISKSNGTIVSHSTDYAPLYDNDWWNISLGAKDSTVVGQANTFEVRYAKVPEHTDKLTHTGSVTVELDSTYANSWNANQTLYFLGSGSRGSTTGSFSASVWPATASVQEFRSWAEYINDDAFHQHAFAPTSIVGNTVQMAYNDLILRYPFGTDLLTDVNLGGASTVDLHASGSIPRPDTVKGLVDSGLGGTALINKIIAGTNNNWPNTSNTIDQYEPVRETYYVNVPNTVGPRGSSNKIRIEENTLRGDLLSNVQSFEVSPYDSNPLDTEELTVTLSPADQIDTDISMQFGGFDLHEYIGDPRDKYKTEYTSLRDTKNLYFKKFSSAYNVWAFMKLLKSMNKGLFTQIESMLPERADKVVGIEVRPNLLERIKIPSPMSMSQETMYLTASIAATSRTSGSWLDAVTGDANSSQVYENSQYSHLTAPIDIGVRSSQQGLTGKNRFILGSEYIGVSFTEATMSAQQTYISSSTILSGGDEYKFVPTFNRYRRPTADLSPTDQKPVGSSAKALSSIYPKSTDVAPQYFSSPAQRRLIIDGSRMTGPGFNQPSTQTIDGGPVAGFILTNPNSLYVADPSDLPPSLDNSPTSYPTTAVDPAGAPVSLIVTGTQDRN